MDGIKAHCMGMEFPKRDALETFLEGWAKRTREIDRSVRVPSAADLDAVAEEQKAKEQTSGKTDRSQS